MAQVTAQLVKQLRDMTGVGMMDAKKALVQVEGDIDKAVDFYVKQDWQKLLKKQTVSLQKVLQTYQQMETLQLYQK